MKFILNLFSQWRAKRLQRAVAKTSTLNPNRQLCEAILKEIQPQNFLRYSPQMGMAMRFTTIYPNVEVYVQKLQDFARLIQQEQLIPPELSLVEEIDMPVDRFFVSSDRYYIDPSRAVAQLKVAGLQLCELMKNSDTETEGYYEHNLRMLTKLFINLQGVSLALVNVSLKSSR
jgi:hypothetical protein